VSSTTQLIIGLVLSLVWAWLGYRLSENDRRTLGRTPWGLPSMVWALFWFIFVILGLVLYLIAHTNGVRRAQQLRGGPAASAVAVGPESVAQRFPAYPQPANSNATPRGPEESGGTTGEGRAAVPEPSRESGGTGEAPPPAAPPPAVSPPAWHPDPSGRFQFRWWDGREWTSHVAINGQVMVDTSPDQRIGPY
jgi:Protein of unknown function (DUF2510)